VIPGWRWAVSHDSAVLCFPVELDLSAGDVC